MIQIIIDSLDKLKNFYYSNNNIRLKIKDK